MITMGAITTADHDVRGRREIMGSTLVRTPAAGNAPRLLDEAVDPSGCLSIIGPARVVLPPVRRVHLDADLHVRRNIAKAMAAAVAAVNATAPPTLLIKIATKKQNSAKPSRPGRMPRSSAKIPA